MESFRGAEKVPSGPNTRCEAENNQEMPDAIVQSIRKQCRNLQKEREIISMTENNLNLTTKVQKTKRVASSQLKETLRAKKRTKDWAKIMNTVHGAKKMSDTFLEDYGELVMPPHVVVDPSLDP